MKRFALVISLVAPEAYAQEAASIDDLTAGLAMAALCREKFGDDDLLEVASERFMALSVSATGKPEGFNAARVVSDIRASKPDMTEINASPAGINFLAGVCSRMKEALIK